MSSKRSSPVASRSVLDTPTDTTRDETGTRVKERVTIATPVMLPFETAQRLLEVGRAQEALEVLERDFALGNDSAAHQVLVARAAFQSADVMRAVRALRRAVLLSRDGAHSTVTPTHATANRANEPAALAPAPHSFDDDDTTPVALPRPASTSLDGADSGPSEVDDVPTARWSFSREPKRDATVQGDLTVGRRR